MRLWWLRHSWTPPCVSCLLLDCCADDGGDAVSVDVENGAAAAVA